MTSSLIFSAPGKWQIWNPKEERWCTSLCRHVYGQQGHQAGTLPNSDNCMITKFRSWMEQLFFSKLDLLEGYHTLHLHQNAITLQLLARTKVFGNMSDWILVQTLPVKSSENHTWSQSINLFNRCSNIDSSCSPFLWKWRDSSWFLCNRGNVWINVKHDFNSTQVVNVLENSECTVPVIGYRVKFGEDSLVTGECPT